MKMEKMDYKLTVIVALCVFLAGRSCETIRHDWGFVAREEYCDFEQFKAGCSPGYTLQILQATYGHIGLGKCVTVDVGYFGCKVDVTHIMEQKCQSNNQCEVGVLDAELRNTQPCDRGINIFLDAVHACVRESPEYKTCGTLMAKPSDQFISSQQMSHSSCSSSHIPKIRAEQGQSINITLVDLRPSDQRRQPVSFGVVVDDATQEQMTLTLNGQDEQVVGMSTTNSVSLVLDEIYDAPPFIIGYRAYGCPDITGPKGTHVERDGSEATVKCIDTEQKWHLKCRGVHWIGVIGTCTPMAPVTRRPQTQPTPIGDDDKLLIERDIVYLIVICATVFLSVLVITTGYVCLKRAQIARGVSKPKPPPEAEWAFGANQTMTLLAKTRPDSDYLHPAAYQLDDSQSMPTAVYDTPLPNPPTIKRNNDEDYNATVSSTSTDYKKYFVLDKDYMNTKEFINNV